MAETCIWCGHELMDDATHENVYACGSVQHPRSDVWNQSTGCVEILQSRERIQRAVEVLEGAERYEPVIDQHGGIDWLDIPEGTTMLSEPANEAIAILKGETDGKAE